MKMTIWCMCWLIVLSLCAEHGVSLMLPNQQGMPRLRQKASSSLHMNAVIGDPSTYGRPKKTIVIYEYESSPFSRKVRQAASQLDLSVEYRPCPGARYGFSDQLSSRTYGSRTVPFMNDPGNPIGTLANIQESDMIVEYLFDNFGPGKSKIPSSLKGPFAGRGAGMDVSKPYAGLQQEKIVANVLKRPLELWGFEGSGDSQPIRGLLCSLCLAHKAINCSKGSANLAALKAKSGGKIPYLEDPNTGKKITGVNECRSYLIATYGPTPSK